MKTNNYNSLIKNKEDNIQDVIEIPDTKSVAPELIKYIYHGRFYKVHNRMAKVINREIEASSSFEANSIRDLFNNGDFPRKNEVCHAWIARFIFNENTSFFQDAMAKFNDDYHYRIMSQDVLKEEDIQDFLNSFIKNNSGKFQFYIKENIAKILDKRINNDEMALLITNYLEVFYNLSIEYLNNKLIYRLFK
jgi:hypothetical protein